MSVEWWDDSALNSDIPASVDTPRPPSARNAPATTRPESVASLPLPQKRRSRSQLSFDAMLAELFDTGQEWRERAACRGADTDLFFPEQRGHGVAAEALKFCQRCPVRLDCAAFACAVPSKGWFGGMNTKSREKIRRRMPS